MIELAPGIWELNRPFKMAGISLGHRMTIVRLRNGELWVHSPVELDEKLATALETLGVVRHLVAPSRYHDLHWPKWLARFPEANFCCPQGFRETHPGWKFHRVLSPNTPEPWEQELPKVLVGGMPKINEYLFLHRPSRTLIVTDLLFNLDPNDQGWLGKLFLKLNGISGKPGCSQIFRRLIKNPSAFRSAIAEVLRWDFDRVIVGHGSNILQGGKAALENALSWTQ